MPKFISRPIPIDAATFRAVIPNAAAFAPVLTFPVAFANPSMVASFPFNPWKYFFVASSESLMILFSFFRSVQPSLILLFHFSKISSCSLDSPYVPTPNID